MNDDELLDALARSLAAPPAVPSDAELAAFHAALAPGHGAVVALRPPGGWLARHWPAVAASAVAVALAAGASVVASGRHHAPAPVKVLTTSEARLRDALASGDRSAIASAAADVRTNLAKLSDDDRKDLGPNAEDLLAKADGTGAHPAAATGTDEPDQRNQGAGPSGPLGSSRAPGGEPAGGATTEPDDHRDARHPGGETTTSDHHEGPDPTEPPDHGGHFGGGGSPTGHD